MANKTIITVATTGAWPKKENNPNVPMTPSEIADDVYACWKAGAAVAHLHMRDDNGKKWLFVARVDRPSRNDAYSVMRDDLVFKIKGCFRPIPFAALQRITDRILQEVKGVNRVAFDLTPKPCGTIEWE